MTLGVMVHTDDPEEASLLVDYLAEHFGLLAEVVE